MIKKHRSKFPNCTIRKITGPPENWITAVEKNVWAVQRGNAAKLKGVAEGDILIFHSSQSVYSTKSGIIGFGIVENVKEIKDEMWWQDEIKQKENIYPNVIRFSEIFLTGDRTKVDIRQPIQNKDDKQIRIEAEALLKGRITHDEIKEKFNYIFPKQGTLSLLRGIDNDSFVDYIVSRKTVALVRENAQGGLAGDSEIQNQVESIASIDYQILELYFQKFASKVQEMDGKSFRSFSASEYMREQESYKDDIWNNAREKLKIKEWKKNLIGSGSLVDYVIQAIEQKQNNLVMHQARYGEKAREHSFLYLVKGDKPKLFQYESILYSFYKDEGISDEVAFQKLSSYSNRYPFIAFLFFIKDKKKYLPVKPSKFDEIFGLLNIKFHTSTQCSWKNYSEFLSIIDKVWDFLRDKLEANERDVTFLDAHSFLWTLLGIRLDAGSEKNRSVSERLSKLELSEWRETIDVPVEPSKDQKPPSDYDPKRDLKNKIVGEKAEQFVIRTERDRLREAHRNDLADKVEQISLRKNCGYDVLSFEEDGKERPIEVKGTVARKLNGLFYLTQNELALSKQIKNLHLYIVYDVDGEYKIKYLVSPEFMDPKLFHLKPSQYQVRYKPQN